MYEQRLPIEEWKSQKQKERNDTIAAQKKVLQEVVQDGQRLADYLYGRGRLGSHITSGNAALVLQTLPQARAVLTAKDWDILFWQFVRISRNIINILAANS